MNARTHYRITSERELRREFWCTFPHLPRKKIRNYAGTGLMHRTDTRVAWADWIDGLWKAGDISRELNDNATL